MQLKKVLEIVEIRKTNFSNGPYKLVLDTGETNRKREPQITWGKQDVPAKVRLSLNLVGKKLICSFRSRKHRSYRAEVRAQSKRAYDPELLIISVKMFRETTPYLLATGNREKYRGRKFRTVKYTLEITNFKSDGIHPTVFPCPCYQFLLELTPEEYRQCKKLPADSVFKVKFQLKKH